MSGIQIAFEYQTLGIKPLFGRLNTRLVQYQDPLWNIKTAEAQILTCLDFRRSGVFHLWPQPFKKEQIEMAARRIILLV